MKLSRIELKRIIKEVVDSVRNEVLSEDYFARVKATPLDKFVAQELSEADMLGATTKAMTPDEMQTYLQKVRGEPVVNKKTGLPKLDKNGNPVYVSTADKVDKYKMPYVHRGNIKIKDESDHTFDLDKLKAAITQRPDKILKQNEKITHSGGGSTVYYNIGLPALKGLAVNEKTGEFVVVDTCPGAGACKVYCYAKKGGYVQWKASSGPERYRCWLFTRPAPDMA